MAISYRSISAVAYGTRTNSTGSQPAGAASGDRLIAVGTFSGTSAPSVTPPSGWTQVATLTYNRPDPWYTVVTVWEAPYGVSAWTWSHASCDSQLTIECWQGVDGTTPIDVTPSTAIGTGGTPTAPSITTVTDGCQILLARGSWDGNAVTPTAGWTERADAPVLWLGDKSQTTAGATGTGTVPHGNNSEVTPWGIIQMALRPASGGTPASAAGSLSLTGAAAATASAGASGALALTGAATARADGVGAGALALTGAASASGSAQAAGGIALVGAATASAAASAAGTLTLAGAASATSSGSATAAGGLVLTGAAQASAAAMAAGTLTLAGAAVASSSGPATAAGGLVLTGAAVASAQAAAAGAVVLAGAAAASGGASAAGGLTLAGTAQASSAGSASASGALILTGAAVATAQAVATGSLLLVGAAIARAAAAAAGGLTLIGAASASGPPPDSTPRARTLTIRRESRTMVILHESRTLHVRST